MTKQLLSSFLFIILFLSGKSQTSQFEYGFQGGLNINSISGNAISKDHRGAITGLSIGGHFKLNTSDHFGIKMLISYDENGYALRSLFLDNSSSPSGQPLIKVDFLKRLNFLNVPIVAEYSFGNKIRMNLDAGVFMGFLLNSILITKYKDPVPAGQPSEIRTSSKGNQTFNYGLSVGFGIQYPIAPKIKLDLDLRNHTGLANLIKESSTNSKMETNCFAILAGISFEL